ncbi:MAG: DNA-processing protein DprA, partial [Flavicella sp.]
VFSKVKLPIRNSDDISFSLAQKITNANTFHEAEKELEILEKQQITALYYKDRSYPESLKNCADGPIVLFSDGDFQMEYSRCISIVGTRNMTNYGKGVCENLIANLAAYNPIIVSGFAYGVDMCAHLSAIDNDLQTIGVFAHGFGHLYPKDFQSKKHLFYKKGGFLTEFWHDQAPIREYFLQRNRIVAGLSQATIVIESALKGGALITAAFANSYQREVCAIPGNTNARYSQGCNALIRDNKAALIANAEDLVAYLGWNTKVSSNVSQQPNLFLELNEEEQVVYNYIKVKEQAQLDAIALGCKLPIHKLAALLIALEIKGCIQKLPGKSFRLI